MSFPKARPKVLVVDDEPSICWGFKTLLGEEGYDVHVASSAEAGLKLAQQNRFQLVVLDVRLPGEDGLSALPKFRAATDEAPVVVITAFGDLETAVTAVNQGAFDYLTKPFPLDEASRICRQAMLRHGLEASISDKAQAAISTTDRSLIGRSPEMQSVFRQIAMVAKSPLSVLITGEIGTGKELVAAAIHHNSDRASYPLLSITPVAPTETLFESELFGHVAGAFDGASSDRKGLFELAEGGSILLDEVSELPLPTQVKLLKAIEQQQFTRVGDVRPQPCNVRLIAATHRDLPSEVLSGRFREDLMYRLSAVRIHLPPLRNRKGDVELLARYFLKRLAHPYADQPLSSAVLKELESRPWYGNVRELRHAIEHAAVYARNRPLDLTDFPSPQATVTRETLDVHTQLKHAVEAWTRDAITHAPPHESQLHETFLASTEPTLFKVLLEYTGNNRAAAAEKLGMHRATLRDRLRKYSIDDT